MKTTEEFKNKMDNLTNLLEGSNNMDNRTYILHFMRLMNNFMTRIIEILYEARDKRETNEVYALIFRDINELHRYLAYYIRTAMRGEDINIRDLTTPQRSNRRRRN